MTSRSTIALVSSKSSSLTNFRGPLIDAFIAAGHRVVGFGPEVEPDTIAALAERGAAFDHWPLARAGLNPAPDARSVAVLTAKFRRLRPDVVLSYTMKPTVYGSFAARAAGVPRIASMVTGLGFAFQAVSLTSRLAAFPATALLRAAFRFNDRVLVYNDDILREFSARHIFASPEQIVRVPGSGVDTDHYGAQPPVLEPVTFTLIARLLEPKGIREWVEAARRVRARHPEARFVLVGDYDPNPSGLKPAEVEAWARQGVIEYLGPVRDVRPVLSRTSVYVLPSWAEGVPRTVLEAMSMGRPIVTTDAPGCRDTVEEGVNGYKVPLRDASALAAAMERFIAEPERIVSMGAASRRLVLERWDVRVVNRIVLQALGL